MGNYASGSLDAVREMICRPDTLVGGGDGGAHVTVISDASYPTYMLQGENVLPPTWIGVAENPA